MSVSGKRSGAGPKEDFPARRFPAFPYRLPEAEDHTLCGVMSEEQEVEKEVDPSHLYLSIRGDFNAPEFVARSGLEFTSSWTRGDLTRSGQPYKFSACSYALGYERYDQVSELLSRAEPVIAQISPALLRMAAIYELTFRLVLVPRYPAGAMGTGIYLGSRMMGMLSALGADFDADIYLY